MKISKFTHSETIGLYHNEVPAKINQDTGEITVVRKRGRPLGSLKVKHEELWLPNAVFQKHYPKVWEWLSKQLTPLEFKCAVLLGIKAEAYTNSLKPLDDSTSYRYLSDSLGISLGLVEYTMRKLFTLGVYGRFETYNPDKPYTKFWIFNPYLSFNGKVISSEIGKLFEGTYCYKAFLGLDFIVILPEKIKKPSIKK